jgi:3-isopropylmalate/(R)-2-methylmalate dehydratase small subunit
MEPFTTHNGLVVAMDRANVDTDQIIPKQFLKRIERTGFGQFLFYDWRFNDDGTDNPEFELNQPSTAGASILLARDNFGSGSSREHAVWAVADYGIRALIAPSFADIFYNNCFKNGILPIRMESDIVESLFQRTQAGTLNLTVDLNTCTVSDADGWSQSFDVEPARRHNLLNGLDDIALTMAIKEKIDAYEERHPLPSIN